MGAILATLLALALVPALGALPAFAGSIRVWPAAVVVDDVVLLRDVAEIGGFDADEEARLGETRLADAPAPGGSVTLSLAAIRDAVSGSSFNMSTVTLRGAVRCAVSRPAAVAARSPASLEGERGAHHAKTGGSATNGTGGPATGAAAQSTNHDEHGASAASTDQDERGAATLRRAVIDHLNNELARYGGTADVTFESAAKAVLELSGPAYEFRVHRRSGAALGSVNLEVAVLSDGATVQTLSLRVTVRLTRSVVTARGPINQDAIVREKDVHTTSLSFTRLDGLGVSDPAAVVGQRAKRFIEAGSVIGPEDLEAVPLVTRGQIVALESIEGGISVASSAKAGEDGHFGESILVRDPNQKGVEFEAVVVGVGRVRVGGAAPLANARLAMRSEK